MPSPKKLKKWRSQAQEHAENAEHAADRAEAALRRIEELTGASAPGSAAGDPADSEERSRVYTSVRGADDTPPAAAVP
ncbi:hypothetical protein [Prauserella cavernicola]|uniref:Uncharacterized protein n=1 Tax=Prauserella cavernicola TaxID=2800127 RepID=A0A934QNC2_9PSEU|nr:hypothetical protein [Prauserella cavernicola]MBK1783801.1 hypothetical protein [Prauserella cavernicola]